MHARLINGSLGDDDEDVQCSTCVYVSVYGCVCAIDLTSTIECDLLCFAEIDARHAVSMRWSVVSTSFDWEIVPDLIGPM